MRIGLLVDSACDLPKSYFGNGSVSIIPATVRIGDYLAEDCRDEQETLTFYETRLDQKSDDFAESMPYSSEKIEELILGRLALEFDHVFCLTISASRSAIYEVAAEASVLTLTKSKRARRDAGIAERFDFSVISSRNVFTGQAVQVAELMRLIDKGATPDEVAARMEKIVPLTQSYMVPADLFYIHRRASKKGEESIGVRAYMAGSLLDVTPIVHFNQDESSAVAKVRGFAAACEKLFNHVGERLRGGLEAPFVCVSYGGPLEKLSSLPGFDAMVTAARGSDVVVLVSLMSMTAAVNVGPGAVSVAFVASGQTLS